MAYDLHRLFNEVHSLLGDDPRITLLEVSHQLQVERHTVEKAVRLESKKTFRELQRQCLYRRACGLLCEAPQKPLKQIASTLGYSTVQALHRFLVRTSGLRPTELRRVLGFVRSGQAPPFTENLPQVLKNSP